MPTPFRISGGLSFALARLLFAVARDLRQQRRSRARCEAQAPSRRIMLPTSPVSVHRCTSLLLPSYFSFTRLPHFLLMPAFSSACLRCALPHPAHSLCAQIRWSAAQSPPAVVSCAMKRGLLHSRRHRQSTLRNQLHRPLNRNSHLRGRPVPGRPSCSCSSSRSSRACRSATSWLPSSVCTRGVGKLCVISAILFCSSGLDGRLPSSRTSAVLVHLLFGPSSLFICALISLPMP